MSLATPLAGAPGDVDGCPMLGALGDDLVRLAGLFDLRVPDGFVITTEAFQRRAEIDLPGLLREQIAALEQRTGRSFGCGAPPLLVAVRPSAIVEVPGLVLPVLDLGTCPVAHDGLVGFAGERFALDTRLRMVRAYVTIVGGRPADAYDRKIAEARAFADADVDDEVPVDVLRLLVARLEAMAAAHGVTIPDDPHEQLIGAVTAAFDRWAGEAARLARTRARRPADDPLALVVQAMVYGNVDEDSGSGVVWSRDPETGRPGLSGTILPRAQGAGLTGGAHRQLEVADLAGRYPESVQLLADHVARLEAHHRDICAIEIAVERGTIWVLGSRVGAPTGAAALRVAVALAEAGAITKEEAVAQVSADHIEQVMHSRVGTTSGGVLLTTGLAASPGAAIGEVVFSADAAASAAAEGRDVILVRQETSPEDVHGMSAAVGILTTRGGLASHAAVVARGWGKPAVCGAEAIHIEGQTFFVNGMAVHAGDVISIDGGSGAVLLGRAETVAGDRPSELDTLLRWADEIRAGRLGVRANADTGADAAVAREFGAEGIGLCRTEHMFLGDDRLPIVRQLILADGAAAERIALTRLRFAQKADFVELLEAMDGLPVTVRLLDPPLHEFLPDLVDLEVRAATGALDDEGLALLDAARRWREHNPMIGTRGVRLGWLKPGLYEMQVRALVDAMAERAAAGGDPQVEVMIPLTVSAAELAGARQWVTRAVAEAGTVDPSSITVGTMIETPRAALRAGDLAAHADFFSFGTNDLSQLTFGFSRDDVEGRLMFLYLDEGLLEANPFHTLDGEGVGELVRLGVERGRAARPDLKLGVCGEHGGDPASIALFVEAGVDYVSCSPYRVPIARLAAAQALLAESSP
jgi:pyruvate,orthophosphate dikinase